MAIREVLKRKGNLMCTKIVGHFSRTCNFERFKILKASVHVIYPKAIFKRRMTSFLRISKKTVRSIICEDAHGRRKMRSPGILELLPGPVGQCRYLKS